MLNAGQEVNTKYGEGVVVSVGAVHPHEFVRIHSNSRIYIFNSADVEVEASRSDLFGTCDVIEPPDQSGVQLDRRTSYETKPTPSVQNHLKSFWRVHQVKSKRLGGEATLAVFVRARLAELGMKQSEFCRLTGFDQGLLSKIQSWMISSLSLETALRLALGLSVPPERVFELIGRPDLNELIMKAYGVETGDAPRIDAHPPAPVLEITRLASQANELGHDLGPLIVQLQ